MPVHDLSVAHTLSLSHFANNVLDALTVMAPYTIIALMVTIRREMANPTQAFSGGEENKTRV